MLSSSIHASRRRSPRWSVAEVLGVHRTYMSGVERGERNLTLKSVERMAEKLEMEVLELMK